MIWRNKSQESRSKKQGTRDKINEHETIDMGRKVDIDSLYRVPTVQICPLCDREITVNWSDHHLIPKSRGGAKGETVRMHKICHVKVHSLFNEKQLEKEYDTIEKILGHEEIQTFVKWVKTKPVDYYDTSKTNHAKRK